MHEIEKISPSTRSRIRDHVFNVLAHFASSNKYGPIRVKKLFLMVADELVKSGIVDRPEFIGGKGAGGQKFIVLVNEDQVSPVFPNYGLPEGIASLIRQTVWELYIKGILTPAIQASPNIHTKATWVSFDAFMISPYGVQILTDVSDRIKVYDPDGYIANFVNADPAPDPEMMKYLCECVSVFRDQHLLASVVLLAIASERLIEVLAEALRDALGEQGATWFSQKFANRRDISTRFQSLTGKLMDQYSEELNNAKLKDGFQTVVTLTFDAIRLARNDVAHIARREFTWNEVSGLLHNFVQFFIYINQIIKILSENPKNSAA